MDGLIKSNEMFKYAKAYFMLNDCQLDVEGQIKDREGNVIGKLVSCNYEAIGNTLDVDVKFKIFKDEEREFSNINFYAKKRPEIVD